MAWRKQPYYDQLHPWARNNFDKEIYVLVFVNDEATLIPSRKGRTSVRKDNGPGFATYKVQVTPGVPFGGVGWQLSPLVPRSLGRGVPVGSTSLKCHGKTGAWAT